MFIAVGQHLGNPLQLVNAAIRLDGKGRMALEHPLDGLGRNAGRGPGGGITRGNLAGIAEAGFQCHAVLTLQHRHFHTGLGQIPCSGYTHHATTQYDYLHFLFLRAAHHALSDFV